MKGILDSSPKLPIQTINTQHIIYIYMDYIVDFTYTPYFLYLRFCSISEILQIYTHRLSCFFCRYIYDLYIKLSPPQPRAQGPSHRPPTNREVTKLWPDHRSRDAEELQEGAWRERREPEILGPEITMVFLGGEGGRSGDVLLGDYVLPTCFFGGIMVNHYGCFLKWWYPQNTSKWSFLVGKPIVVGYHHFRKPPYKDPY